MEGAAVSELSVQHPQCGGIVDIVPWRQNMHAKPDVLSTINSLIGDTAGAPFDIVKHAPVSLLEPEKIVASVFGGSEHGAVSRLSEQVSSLDQKPGRQGRAVGVKDDGAGMSSFQ